MANNAICAGLEIDLDIYWSRLPRCWLNCNTAHVEFTSLSDIYRYNRLMWSVPEGCNQDSIAETLIQNLICDK